LGAGSPTARAEDGGGLGSGPGRARAAGGETEAGDPLGGLPTRFVLRPLTLPAGILRIDLAGAVGAADEGRGIDATAEARAGFGLGVSDRFEVGASLLRPSTSGGAVALSLAPDVELLDPGLYGMLRLFRGTTELAVRLEAYAPVTSERFRLLLGVPIRVHGGDVLRIDSGVFLETDFGPLGDGIVPLLLAAQLSDTVFVLGEVTVRFPDPEVAVEVGLGTTLAGVGETPLGDLELSYRLRDAQDPAGDFAVWIRASLYLRLFGPAS